MLQTRIGKRNGVAAIKMAVDMFNENMIDKKTAILRVNPNQLDELLHPALDKTSEDGATKLTKGLPAGPGGAKGRVVFTADDAEEWNNKGEKVILVREETSPEDVHGMHAAEAILTARGGMTSHAALVARGWGKCCIVGCNELNISVSTKQLTVGETVVKEGDWITMNGTLGVVYLNQLELIPADPDRNLEYKELMTWADEIRKLKIRTNAESPEDAKQAIKFGAEGIGLCRTEHMFFDEQRILAMRKMILSDSEEERREAVMGLLPFQKEDFKGTLKAMEDKPVTIRLLDPPLHEFITLDDKQVDELADKTGIEKSVVNQRISSLHELNPMLGHRGCRLGIAYPVITEMQARAILEATAELIQDGVNVLPEIMIPLVGTVTEYIDQEKIDVMERKRSSEATDWRDDIRKYKEEVLLRREEDLASFQSQLAELDKVRLQEAAEFEKRELARKDSIRNSKLENEIQALKDMLTVNVAKEETKDKKLDSTRFAMLDNEMQGLRKMLLQAMLQDSLEAQQRAQAKIAEELASREKEKASRDSIIADKIAALDAVQADLQALEAENGEGLDTKMLIIIGLGVLSVILLVLMVLQKGKKGVQVQGAYPPGPIPPYPYPPPPRRRRRRRKKASEKEAKETKEVKEEVKDNSEEKDQNQNGVTESAPPVSAAQVAAMEAQNETVNDSVTQMVDDPNVLKSEIDDIRKSVVSMSVGQPARTSTIVKEWLEQPAPEAPASEEPSSDGGGEEEEKGEE